MPIPEFVVQLRRHVGSDVVLWMPAVTAVVRRGDEVLLVRRSDNGQWAPITGIVDPGEEPAVAAAREAREEACVKIRVDRLASVGATTPITHVNGDRAVYLDHTFACTWVGGDPAVGDDESVAVGWFRHDELPPMKPVLRERIEAALAGEERTRFVAP